MPERGFNTEFWSDPFVRRLNLEAQHLYIYLWTNQHCNQAGLYQITLDTIAFETKIREKKLPELLKSLEPKVKWYEDQDLIWVKNFLKRQAKSPKFLTAAAKCLNSIHHNGAIKELLEYNLQKYSISIPYRYSIATVSIPSVSVSGAVSSSDADSRAKAGGGEVSREKPEPTRPKPKQQEAGVFLDMIQQHIGTKLVQRPKLQGLVRPLLVSFPEATPESLFECFKWLKENDSFCRSRDSPTVVSMLPSKYPEWAAGKLVASGGKEERHGRAREHGRRTKPDTEPYEWEEAPDEPDDTS